MPVYWAAQYLGAFLGAAVVFGVYSHSIDLAGGKGATTRAIFGTYPNDAVGPSSLTLAFDEMLGTALLVTSTRFSRTLVTSGLLNLNQLVVTLRIPSTLMAYFYSACKS